MSKLLRSTFALILFAALACAQQGRGSMQGLVTDRSGAAIPYASVTIRNTDTNAAFTTTTNGEGLFTAPALPVGQYEVTVEKEGFKRGVRSGITLLVDQRAQVDVPLEVGGTTESVTVTSDAPLVDTSSATVGKVIENRRISELPLNGRNALALVLLTPNVKSQAGPTNSGFADRGIALSSISINGGPSALNAFVLDGGVNTQGYLADVNVNPTVDGVQEFKVQSATMSAEYGFTAGGVVNIVTKSGTNQLHGAAYEFFRNDKLDARNAFAVTRPPFRYNQYGGALGGPVFLPKLYNGKNRTFFFYNYEGWQYRRATQVVTSTPTVEWRNGNFSNLRDASGNLVHIYDPATTRPNPSGNGVIRDAFPGNLIPSNRIDPAANALLQFYPLPNRTPVNPFTQQNNYLSTINESRDMDQHTAKVDHRFSDQNSLFVRYSHYHHFTDGPNNGSDFWPDPVVRARYDSLQSQNGVISDTHTFTPTLLNEFRLGVTRQYFPFQAASYGLGLPRKLGLPESIPNNTLPLISNGFQSFGPFTVGVRGSLTWQFFDMVSYINGAHSFKFGLDQRLNQANNYQREVPSHSFTFPAGLTQNPQNTAGTGYAFATYLLGYVGSATGYNYAGESEAAFSTSLFAQDDWKVSRRLTLNLGLRWDYQQWPRERNNGTSNFDPDGLIPGTKLRGRTVYAGVDYGPAPFQPMYTSFGPRIGLAWDLFGNGKTVFRAGYSIFYPSSFYRDMFGNTQGFANTTTAYNPPGGNANYPAFLFKDGFPFPPLPAQGSKLGPAAFLGQAVAYDQTNEKVPMSQQWTASLQHELKGWLLDATYTANHSTNLVAGSYSINQIPDSAYALGLQLQNSVPNPYAGQAPGSLGGPTITLAQSLKPWPYYSDVTVRNPHLGDSIYHAFLFSTEKRFSRGLVFLASFTFGKLISDSIVTPVNFGTGIEQVAVVGYQYGNVNRRLERSIDPTDVSSRLVLSGVYELPFGPGRAVRASNRVINTLIGGWQLNTITVLQTGNPIVVRGASNNRADRPNSTGKSAALSNPNATEWFDVTAFVNPPLYQLGNVGRTLPDVRAPGAFNMDLSAIKDTRLFERASLQFRAEAFNWLNHVNLGIPNAAFAPGPNGTNQSGSLGTISSARDARIIQFALKLVF